MGAAMLKGLRQRQIAVVRQGPGLDWLYMSRAYEFLASMKVSHQGKHTVHFIDFGAMFSYLFISHMVHHGRNTFIHNCILVTNYFYSFFLCFEVISLRRSQLIYHICCGIFIATKIICTVTTIWWYMVACVVWLNKRSIAPASIHDCDDYQRLHKCNYNWSTWRQDGWTTGVANTS